MPRAFLIKNKKQHAQQQQQQPQHQQHDDTNSHMDTDIDVSNMNDTGGRVSPEEDSGSVGSSPVTPASPLRSNTRTDPSPIFPSPSPSSEGTWNFGQITSNNARGILR